MTMKPVLMKSAPLLVLALLVLSMSDLCSALSSAEVTTLTAMRTQWPVLTTSALAVPWTGSVSSACSNVRSLQDRS